MSEALDQVRLADYLGGPVTVERFPHGFSNLTYGVRAGDQDLVLRRPPVGSTVKSAHDMGREYRILQALHPIFGRVPRPIALCEDDSVLGAPFYLMEKVDGVILRDKVPPGVDMHALSTACIDTLVDIHAVDMQAAGLASLGRGDDYAARQIRGWTDRYQKSRTDDVPALEKAAAWLAGHIPPSAGNCLIHNDYKYDNLVLNPHQLSEIRAVLDWEMATIGDPLMDLGTSLGYWMESGDSAEMRSLPFSLTALPGNLTRTEVVQRYASQSGRSVSNPAFYYAYGLFKIAVVAQQIYYRYRQGLTQDPRFAHLLGAIHLLSAQAWRVSQSGSLQL